MILVLAIILFIIFLIYSIRPSKCEEYTLEGLKLSWSNKASIEGIVTKWIVTLKDSSGNVIHTYENSDAGNLKDFTDVTMNIVDKKEFDDKIIGNNTLELYYNDVKPDTKLYTKTVTFTQDDFGMSLDMSNLEEIVPNTDCVGKYIKLKRNKTTEGAERFACGPQDDSDRHYCQFWKHKIETEKGGTGKACSRANNFVIKTQWPTETTASKRIGTSFQNDPNPNTDENVLNNPQYYKKIWDSAPPLITEIPHQIAGGADGWCKSNAVHQDVPGCGRICSSWEYIGSKNKGSWGLWGGNQNGIDCPAAELDQVWKLTGGSTSGRPNRELAVGKYSGTSASAVDLTGGFKWYYYKGSYFSDINSFSGKTSTKQGENVTDFSSKHKATSGHLRNDGNEDNYSVKWEGYFVPKKTGSHKFWTESDDMSYLTIDGVVAVDNGGLHGMVKAPKKELNPPESSRKYSSVWSNQAPGVGHARSMLDSDQAWSAAHNVVDQWMEIDMGTVSLIAGVVVQGRKNYDQQVTSFDVFIDGKKVTSTLKYTSSKDTRQSYTFGEPVVGRKVRFRVKGWYSHASMRAGVIPAKSINLTAGKKYSIKIYFGEKGGGDELKVWFQGPGMNSATHNFYGYMLK